MINKNYIERLFKTNYPRMYAVAMALLHDDALARDIIHEVFTTLMTERNVFFKPDDEKNESAYLLTAVRNRSLNEIRNRTLRLRILNRYFLDNEEYDSHEWPDEETISIIHKLISEELTPKAKRVMQLRFESGEKFADIARIMEISETAVYRHMGHALDIIRKKLKNNEKY